MTPISIRNRSPEQSSAIQRAFKAAKMRALFDDVESQLTDPVLIEMTRHMRDTVMSNPEFAEPAAEFTVNKEAWDRLQAHPDVVAAKLKEARAPLSKGAIAMLVTAQEEWRDTPNNPLWDPDTAEAEELFGAGLVDRAIGYDGRASYMLNKAGREWRAS